MVAFKYNNLVPSPEETVVRETKNVERSSEQMVEWKIQILACVSSLSVSPGFSEPI